MDGVHSYGMGKKGIYVSIIAGAARDDLDGRIMGAGCSQGAVDDVDDLASALNDFQQRKLIALLSMRVIKRILVHVCIVWRTFVFQDMRRCT